MEMRLPEAPEPELFVDILFGEWVASSHKVIPVLVLMML